MGTEMGLHRPPWFNDLMRIMRIQVCCRPTRIRFPAVIYDRGGGPVQTGVLCRDAVIERNEGALTRFEEPLLARRFHLP